MKLKLKVTSLNLGDLDDSEQSVKFSVYGVAAMYFRASLPLFLSILLYLSEEDKEKRSKIRSIIEPILGADIVKAIETSSLGNSELLLKCKNFVKMLNENENKIVLKNLCRIAEDNLVRELKWESLVSYLIPKSIGDLRSKLGNINEGIVKLLELTDFPDLLYLGHARVLLRDMGLNDECERYIEIMRTMYNCLVSLYNVGLRHSRHGGPWLIEAANRLGIPITLRPPLYYLLIYFDADNASNIFSGSEGRYAGLLGANLYPFLAIETISNIIALDEKYYIPVPVQPFYMAGDDYLLMAPVEIFAPVIAKLSHAAEKLGLDYSVVVLVVHVHAPLREVVNLAYQFMTKTAKESRIPSIGTEKSLFVFARIASGGQTELSVIPLKLLKCRRTLSLVHNLLNLFSTRTHVVVDKHGDYSYHGRGESLYALARKIVEAYRTGQYEEYELNRFKFLRGLVNLGLETDSSELERLFHEEIIEIPWSPLGPITRVNLGVEVVNMSIQLHMVLPYTLWPKLLLEV